MSTEPLDLDAIRAHGPLVATGSWLIARADRRALLAEVDRLTAALAEREQWADVQHESAMNLASVAVQTHTMLSPNPDDDPAALVGRVRSLLAALAERDAQIAAARAIHRPDEPAHIYCIGCWEAGGEDGAPSWPCSTIRALGGDS